MCVRSHVHVHRRVACRGRLSSTPERPTALPTPQQATHMDKAHLRRTKWRIRTSEWKAKRIQEEGEGDGKRGDRGRASQLSFDVDAFDDGEARTKRGMDVDRQASAHVKDEWEAPAGVEVETKRKVGHAATYTPEAIEDVRTKEKTRRSRERTRDVADARRERRNAQLKKHTFGKRRERASNETNEKETNDTRDTSETWLEEDDGGGGDERTLHRPRHVHWDQGNGMERLEDEQLPEYVPLVEENVHEEQGKKSPDEEDMDWEAEDDFIHAQLAKAVGGFPRREGDLERTTNPYIGPTHTPESSRTMQDIDAEAKNAKNNLRKRIEALKESKINALQQLERSQSSMETASSNVASCKERLERLSAKYTYLQSLKQYVQALCSCLNAKAPLVEEVLEEAKAAHQNRRNAIKDVQLTLQSAAIAAGEAAVSCMMQSLVTGSGMESTTDTCASARREKLLSLVNSTDQDSFSWTLKSVYEDLHEGPKGKELKEVNLQWENRLKDCHEAGSTIFADADTIFSDVEAVSSRIAEWKVHQEDSYFDAYMPLSLGKLLSPFVMLELIGWHPLGRTCQSPSFCSGNVNEMAWVKSLKMFPTSKGRADDTDGAIVQQLLLRIVVPFLHFLVEHCWDPSDVTENDALLLTVEELLAFDEDPPSETMHELLHAIFRRLYHTGENVSVVCWPPMVLAHLTEEAELASTLYYKAVQFLQAVLKWREILEHGTLFALVMDNIIMSKMVPHLRVSFASPHDCLKRLSSLVSMLPENWLVGQHPATNSLREICESLQARMNMEQDGYEEDARICLQQLLSKFPR